MAEPKRPNIILLVLDTARASDFSCYGYPRETTPAIDMIAREGVLYKNAISASPWTLPSHASIFTGMFPSKHGAHEKHKYLDDRYWTLAEVLRSHGYETVAISNNSWINREFGFDRGFNTFIKIWQMFQTETDFTVARREGLPLILEEVKRASKLVWRGNVFKNVLNGIYGSYFYRRYDYGARRINKEIKKWLLKSHERKPFFMFINYLEPHLRYEPPGKYKTMYLPDGVTAKEADRVNQDAWSYVAGMTKMDGRDFEVLRALYDGELRYLDFRIEEVYSFLKERALLDSTMLVITSDHGENIGEHDLMDHQYCLYDTLLKVPLVIRFPEAFQEGKVVEEQVQTVDVFPSIIDLLGINDEEVRREVQGETLLPEELEYRKRKFAISEYLGPQPSMGSLKKRFPEADSIHKYDRSLKAVRTGGFKLIKASDGEDELYNIEKDPHENNNLILVEKEKANELRGVLESWEKSFKPSGDSANFDVDEAIRKRLEALGYI